MTPEQIADIAQATEAELRPHLDRLAQRLERIEESVAAQAVTSGNLAALALTGTTEATDTDDEATP